MPARNPFNSYTNLTRPIVDVWKGLLNRAVHAKRRFNDRADQIMSFYSGGPGAMWTPDYMNRFLGGPQAITAPRFKITLNLAFEEVAIMGPLLFWEMADRKVKPFSKLQLDPMALAGQSPDMQQYFEQLAESQAMDDARNEVRAQVLEHALNYFQREQPGGGLAAHTKLAIFEALTKGAGFLKTEDYSYPFSDRTLVGSFFQSVDDVLVDGDCRDPLWQSANWMAIRHRTLVAETEEHFGLPAGSLTDYATISSQSASYQAGVQPDHKVDVQKDVIEWWEIFSRKGFGNKLTGEKIKPIAPEFDRARGSAIVNGRKVSDDFAYLCICTKCNYPLNLSAMELVQDHATDEWIKSQTDWPTEYWRDNKWPVEMLAFYPHSGTSPWPEAPLAPALGELTCLNILMSAYVQEAFEGRQTIIGYRKGAIQQLESLLTSDKSPLPVEIDPGFKEKLEDCIQFMKRPEVNGDLPKSIEFVMSLVEKRTGLSDMMYGGNAGANPRSATEFQGKMDTVNIRPEYMQKTVAAMQSTIADKEVFCAYTHVSAEKDIAEVLGPLGVAAWIELVTKALPEEILRGTQAIVEASGIRRPNKAKDMADLQGMQQYYLPILAGYMAQTGDPGPLNGFVKAIGYAGEFDVQEFLIPPPQPNEEAQQQQQLEMAKSQAETEKLTAEAEKARADAQATMGASQTAQQDAAVKAQTAEHGMMIKQQTAEHAMGMKEHLAQLAQVTKEQELANNADEHEMTIAERQAEAKQRLAMKLMEAHQAMHQKAATHLQQTAIANSKAQEDAQRGNLINYQKMLFSHAEHQQRMQQQAQLGAGE